MLLLLTQAALPANECILSGFCGVAAPVTAAPAGVMFIAFGLISTGVVGLLQGRRRT